MTVESTTPDLLRRAQTVIPGGVNSPVRAFGGVGGHPVFIRAARGAWLFADDGREYVDYIGAYGPAILGHAHPAVVEAVARAAADGICLGAPSPAEVELAERLCDALPALEMVRLVNSGTEATMSALRLARAVTRREAVVKFAGCYHGHADPFLVAAGSGAATLGVPSSPGVPEAVSEMTLVAPYNDLIAVETLFETRGGGIAAVIVEPVAGNMGLVPPAPGFLAGLRGLCDRHGALLIFDEVMTGFRVGWTGAQGLFGVDPDLTTLGKVIGGGLPVGAFGGRRRWMEQVAPSGPVYQAGTLSGNPLATAAGLATLEILAADDPSPYEQLEATSDRLALGLAEAAARHGVPCTVQRQGSMLGLFLADGPVICLADVDSSDRQGFACLFHALLDQGVHLPPSPYETFFVSLAHGDAEIEATLAAFQRAFSVLAGATGR